MGNKSRYVFDIKQAGKTAVPARSTAPVGRLTQFPFHALHFTKKHYPIPPPPQKKKLTNPKNSRRRKQKLTTKTPPPKNPPQLGPSKPPQCVETQTDLQESSVTGPYRKATP